MSEMVKGPDCQGEFGLALHGRRGATEGDLEGSSGLIAQAGHKEANSRQGE